MGTYKVYCLTMVNGDPIFFGCGYDNVLEVLDWLTSKRYIEIFDISCDTHLIFRKHIVMIKEVYEEEL